MKKVVYRDVPPPKQKGKPYSVGDKLHVIAGLTGVIATIMILIGSWNVLENALNPEPTNTRQVTTDKLTSLEEITSFTIATQTSGNEYETEPPPPPDIQELIDMLCDDERVCPEALTDALLSAYPHLVPIVDALEQIPSTSFSKGPRGGNNDQNIIDFEMDAQCLVNLAVLGHLEKGVYSGDALGTLGTMIAYLNRISSSEIFLGDPNQEGITLDEIIHGVGENTQQTGSRTLSGLASGMQAPREAIVMSFLARSGVIDHTEGATMFHDAFGPNGPRETDVVTWTDADGNVFGNNRWAARSQVALSGGQTGLNGHSRYNFDAWGQNGHLYLLLRSQLEKMGLLQCNLGDYDLELN